MSRYEKLWNVFWPTFFIYKELRVYGVDEKSCEKPIRTPGTPLKIQIGYFPETNQKLLQYKISY